MKNKILTFFSLVLLVGFSACTKTEYVDRGDIENPNRSFITILKVNNWVRVSNASIKYDIPLKDLTDYYVDQGLVHVALSFDDEDTYDVLPTTTDGIAYSINYTTGWITVTMDDPLADDENIVINPPTGDVFAKIVLTKTDYFDYQGIFNLPSAEFDFKPLDIKAAGQ